MDSKDVQRAMRDVLARKRSARMKQAAQKVQDQRVNELAKARMELILDTLAAEDVDLNTPGGMALAVAVSNLLARRINKTDTFGFPDSGEPREDW